MIDNERRKKLLETMKGFNKNNKDEILSFGEEKQEAEIIPSGIKQFDNFVGTGFKKGTFSVLWGGEKVGKSTLVLQAIANAQKDGYICVYIDLEHTFEKERAIALGVNLEELILAERCKNAEQALEIIRTMCKDKVIDMVVVDSIQAMSPLHEQENKGKERGLAEKEMAELARTLSKFFRVVSPDVFNAQVACIMIGQLRMSLGSFIVRGELSGGEALKHWAYQRIFIRRGQKDNSPFKKVNQYWINPENKMDCEKLKEETGFDCVLKLEKTKCSKSMKENSEIHLPFLYDKGFVNEVKFDEEPEIRIDPEATEEEKEIITKELIKKGILKDESTIQEQQIANLIQPQDLPKDPGSIVEKINVTKVPKKRGRPKKIKENK